jgi:1-phosphatidylinositol-4-phosphate 5-kinase
MGVMDYSLLVGVRHARYDVDALHRMQQVAPSLYPESQDGVATSAMANSPLMVPTNESTSNFNARMMSTGYPARVVIAPKEYYFGVIDILQTWNWTKKFERFFKVYILGQPSEGISCMHPQDFKERYQRKIGHIIEHANIVREVTGSWQGKRDVGTAAPLVDHHH